MAAKGGLDSTSLRVQHAGHWRGPAGGGERRSGAEVASEHQAEDADLQDRDRDRENGGNPIFALILLFLAPFVAMLVQMAISRTREFGADRAAVEATGNPDAMANALRRIESYAQNYQMPTAEGTQHMFIINPLAGGGLHALFSTHPPTAKRIEAIMKLKQQGVGRKNPPPIPA